MFFMRFLCIVFVCGREEKCVENVQAESKRPRVSLFLVWRVPRAFYSHGTIFEAAALQGLPPSKALGSG